MSAISTPPRVSTSDGDHTNHSMEPVRTHQGAEPRRFTTETKASFKTTEFFAYLAAVAGVLVAASVVDQADAGGLGAQQAWLYVTILTVGYMASRGLAKSGSRERYTDDRS